MFVFDWDRWFVWKRWVGHSVMCIISGMPKPWFKVGKSSIQYPFVFYEGNMFLTFTISSAMVSRHDEKSIKIHSEGGHPKKSPSFCVLVQPITINCQPKKNLQNSHWWCFVGILTASDKKNHLDHGGSWSASLRTHMSLFGWEDEFPTFHRVVYLPGFSEPSKKMILFRIHICPPAKEKSPKKKKKNGFPTRWAGPWPLLVIHREKKTPPVRFKCVTG